MHVSSLYMEWRMGRIEAVKTGKRLSSMDHNAAMGGCQLGRTIFRERGPIFGE